uniref:Uncharacterized protein n=1 Tax=Cacopsylla melanoneura TaxID=428564 RepID=A0A8D8UHE5_9HEMI
MFLFPSKFYPIRPSIVTAAFLYSFIFASVSGVFGVTSRPEVVDCGRVLTNSSGIVQTPNFPDRFPVPIHCSWRIQNPDPQSVIVLYFTQLFVTSGFTVTEYSELNSPWEGPTILFVADEHSVLASQWLASDKQYVVIDFDLDSLYGTHIRALDNLLDVYGFNVTYEIVPNVRDDVRSGGSGGEGGVPSVEQVAVTTLAASGEEEEEARPGYVRSELCSLVACSFSGHCYADANFTAYQCACFDGFSGSDCGNGPLCQSGRNECENGARCRHAGATHITCLCTEGFTGARCEIPTQVKHPAMDCPLDSDPFSCSDNTGSPRILCPVDESADASPCSACDESVGIPVPFDNARYEIRLGLNVTDNDRKNLTAVLNRTVAKLFRGISKIENLQVLNLTPYEDVTFHFFGPKSDSAKFQMTLLKLLERSKIGPYAVIPARDLGFEQEPLVQNKAILVNQLHNRVRLGKEYILSCVAEGSRFMTFHWFKDNVPINVNYSMREMWTKESGRDSHNQYVSTLGIQSAHKLDQGRYTCQVKDLGYQQCRSLYLEIMLPPLVKISPLTVTLERGFDLTIKCMSPDETGFGISSDRFGYSWVKDGDLFPMNPDSEIWEDLEPGGSVLKVKNIQKSVTYSCLVTAPHVPSGHASTHIHLTTPHTPLCPTHHSNGLYWPETMNGQTARVEAPLGRGGRCIVSRHCTQVQSGARWGLEDWSDCVPSDLGVIETNFLSLTLGYQTTSTNITLQHTADYLSSHPVRYPGQLESTVTLLGNILRLIQHTTQSSWNFVSSSVILGASDYFYVIVNYLLYWQQPLPTFVHRPKVIELQSIIELWSLLWCNQLSGEHKRLLLDSLLIDVRKLYNLTSSIISVQQPSVLFKNSQSTWSPNTSVSFESNTPVSTPSGSTASPGVLNLVIISYANLSQFLTPRYLNRDTDLLYEVHSSVVSTCLGDNGIKLDPSGEEQHREERDKGEGEVQGVRRLKIVVEFPTPDNGSIPAGWNLTCGLSTNAGTSWELTCSLTLTSHTVVCTCHRFGLHALLITLDKRQMSLTSSPISHLRVLVGYSSCMLEVAVTLLHILPRWFRRRSWFLFLKVKFCLVILLLMLLMTYLACQSNMTKSKLSGFVLLIQYLVLVALSCHMSNLLIIYVQIVLPTPHQLKDAPLSIVLILHALSLLLCLSLSLSTTSHVVYYICVISTAVYTLLFFTFHVYVNWTLRYVAVQVQNAVIDVGIKLRRRILFHSGLIVLSLSVTYLHGILYLCYPGLVLVQYLLSLSCFLFGIVVFLVYFVHATPSAQKSAPSEANTGGGTRDYSLDSDFLEMLNFLETSRRGEETSGGEGGGMGRRKRSGSEEEEEGIPLTESHSSGGRMVTFSHDLVSDSEVHHIPPPLSSYPGGGSCNDLDILPPPPPPPGDTHACVERLTGSRQEQTHSGSRNDLHWTTTSGSKELQRSSPLTSGGPPILLCSVDVESDADPDDLRNSREILVQKVTSCQRNPTTTTFDQGGRNMIGDSAAFSQGGRNTMVPSQTNTPMISFSNNVPLDVPYSGCAYPSSTIPYVQPPYSAVLQPVSVAASHIVSTEASIYPTYSSNNLSYECPYPTSIANSVHSAPYTSSNTPYNSSLPPYVTPPRPRLPPYSTPHYTPHPAPGPIGLPRTKLPYAQHTTPSISQIPYGDSCTTIPSQIPYENPALPYESASVEPCTSFGDSARCRNSSPHSSYHRKTTLDSRPVYMSHPYDEHDSQFPERNVQDSRLSNTSANEALDFREDKQESDVNTSYPNSSTSLSNNSIPYSSHNRIPRSSQYNAITQQTPKVSNQSNISTPSDLDGRTSYPNTDTSQYRTNIEQPLSTNQTNSATNQFNRALPNTTTHPTSTNATTLPNSSNIIRIDANPAVKTNPDPSRTNSSHARSNASAVDRSNSSWNITMNSNPPSSQMNSNSISSNNKPYDIRQSSDSSKTNGTYPNSSHSNSYSYPTNRHISSSVSNNSDKAANSSTIDANSILVSTESLVDRITNDSNVSSLLVDGMRLNDIKPNDPVELADSTCTDSSDSAIADLDSNPNLSGADSSAPSDEMGSGREGESMSSREMLKGHSAEILLREVQSTGRRLDESEKESLLSTVRSATGETVSDRTKDESGDNLSRKLDSAGNIVSPRGDQVEAASGNNNGELLTQISNDLDYLLNDTEDFSSLSLKRRKNKMALASGGNYSSGKTMSPGRKLMSPSKNSANSAARNSVRNSATGKAVPSPSRNASSLNKTLVRNSSSGAAVRNSASNGSSDLKEVKHVIGKNFIVGKESGKIS